MKTFYRFDKETKEYIRKEKCEESPLEKGVYLTPMEDNVVVATPLRPPKIKTGFVRLFNGSEWIYEEDHRNDTVYDKVSGAVVKIDYLGPVNDDVTYKKPIEFGIWDVNKNSWAVDKEAKRIVELEQCKKDKKVALATVMVEVDGKIFDSRAKDVEALKDGIERGETRWVLADDSIAVVTTDILKEVLEKGNKKRQEIIDKYINELEK